MITFYIFVALVAILALVSLAAVFLPLRKKSCKRCGQVHSEVDESVPDNIHRHNMPPSPAPRRAEASNDGLPRPRVVFSMSTTVGRFAHVHKTLESLLKSTLAPDVVYLHVPRYSIRTGCAYPRSLSPELEALKSQYGDRLVINRVSEDYGPFTKLWPTLAIERDPTTRIITADDDELYPAQYHEQLLRHSIERPDVVVAYRGLHVKEDGRYEFVSGVTQTTDVDVIEGYTGVVYRRGHFSDSLRPPDPKNSCLTCDDIWTSTHLRNNGVRRVIIAGGLPMGDQRGLGNASHPIQPQNNVAGIDPLFVENHEMGDRNRTCLRNIW